MSSERTNGNKIATNIKDARGQLRPTNLPDNEPKGVFDSRVDALKKDLRKKEDTIGKLQAHIDDLESKLQKSIEEAHERTKQHEKNIKEFEKSSGTAINEILKQERDNLKMKNEQIEIVNTEQKSEIDRLKLSLSKLAGDRMLDGNPYITDLSDGNRPQKLAEKFNGLYDNSWTDAYEDLSKTTENEREICEKLLRILKDCWEFCLTFSNEHLELLKLSFVFASVKDEANKVEILEKYPSKYSKLIQDTRRCFTQQFIPSLCKQYCEQQKENKMDKHVKRYVEDCLDLCWHSAISDPPLDYVFTAVDNVDDFRGYTTGGNIVDFVVWPSMYLHKHGPLLYKGVVQFKDSNVKEQ